jgi:hypothetical protein
MLEVDSTRSRDFTQDTADFLTAAAALLGAVLRHWLISEVRPRRVGFRISTANAYQMCWRASRSSMSIAPRWAGTEEKSKIIRAEINASWQNQSFHNYADYAMSDDFLAALESLIETSQRELNAIMCAEAVWWRCHRRIIADYLISRQISVRHILGPGKIVEAQMTPSAVRQGRTIGYPP